jgi:NAD(P)-dependent dehydrogenase (short-subunit alcohol dehydrogenase family)
VRTRDLHGRKAMVTGAGSGIGRATSVAIARRGADVFLCDVDAEGLAETERLVRELGREALARRVDVADAEAMRAFAAEVHARAPALDLLVNNAGVALGAEFVDTTLEDWDRLLGVNLRGVVHGCHFFVPPMIARGRGGHVVNVASAAGFTATETLSAYCATKFGVVGLSECLHAELARHGIGVTCVCPGFIDTPIMRNSPLRGALDTPAARRRMTEGLRDRGYPPERVAENLLLAVERGRLIAPITPEAWALFYAKRLAPGLLRRVGRWIQSRERRALGIG